MTAGRPGTRTAARITAAVLIGAVVCQCSSSKPTATSSARAVLAGDVAAVATAVDGHDSAGAMQALVTLHSDVTRLEADGQVTSAYAAAVLQSAGQVQTDLDLITTTTSTTTTTTLPPVTAPPHGPGKQPGGGPGSPGHPKH